MSIISKIFGDPNAREIKKARIRVDRINALEDSIKKLSDSELKAKTTEFIDKIDHKKLETSLDGILEEAFAVVRAVSYTHLDVYKRQIRGRDMVSGLPKELKIDSDQVRKALARSVRAIVDAVKHTIEETPPELLADIMDKGVYLSLIHI